MNLLKNNYQYITPIVHYPLISKKIGIELWVKHDDLYQKFGGGNKARKLEMIIKKAQKNNCNAIVTAGGIQSNHIRATAIACAQLGWKSIMIIHAPKPKTNLYEGNLKLIRLCGAKIYFVDKKDVAQAMDNAMDELRKDGFNPLYIWGGGHCLEGSYTYYKATEELFNQHKEDIDYIVLASGTGTTQAGLALGCKKFFPKTKLLGISISRKKDYGIEVIKDSIDQLDKYLNKKPTFNDEIYFDDSFTEEYESVSLELFETIRFSASNGLILDPTYTGKAFQALLQYIRSGTIKEHSNVVFWHTGGLLNLITNSQL